MNLMAKSLVVFVSVVLTSCSSTPDNPFGPWDAFTYTRQDNVVMRRAEGSFETLNKCMNWVTMRTKHTGGSYYCGYECKTKAGNIVRCEKLMGYPI